MKYSKIRDQLGVDLMQEIERKSKPELESLIAESEQSIRQATKERNANPQYQAAKEAVKDLSAGLKEVKKRQAAKIEYALSIMHNDVSEE